MQKLFNYDGKDFFNMEKAILFNVTCKDEIKKLLSPMHILTIEASTSQYNDTLKNIASGKTGIPPAEPFTGTIPGESLVLFCDVKEKKLDKALFKLRSNNISTTYKAVLTPSNSNWTVLRLFLELEREHAAYSNITLHKTTCI